MRERLEPVRIERDRERQRTGLRDRPDGRQHDGLVRRLHVADHVGRTGGPHAGRAGGHTVRALLFSILFSIGLLAAGGSAAQTVPGSLSIQAFVTDAGGAPLEGTHSFVFSFLDGPDADATLLDSASLDTTVSGGELSAKVPVD